MLASQPDRTTTPYRVVLAEVKRVMVSTRKRMEDILAGRAPALDEPWCVQTPSLLSIRQIVQELILSIDLVAHQLYRYESAEQLAAPLLAIYWSLWECGSGVVADGRLLNTLRRIYAFDMCLMKLDIRQVTAHLHA